jgi:hypothetical protein
MAFARDTLAAGKSNVAIPAFCGQNIPKAVDRMRSMGDQAMNQEPRIFVKINTADESANKKADDDESLDALVKIQAKKEE